MPSSMSRDTAVLRQLGEYRFLRRAEIEDLLFGESSGQRASRSADDHAGGGGTMLSVRLGAVSIAATSCGANLISRRSTSRSTRTCTTAMSC